MCKCKSRVEHSDKPSVGMETGRSALERRISALEVRHVELDIRGNPVEATRRESSFAADIMGTLSGDNLAHLYAYVAGMWAKIIEMETALRKSRDRRVLARYAKLLRLPAAQPGDLLPLEHYADHPTELTAFFLAGDARFKNRVDYYTNFYLLDVNESSREQYMLAREHPAFADRGRTDAPEDQLLTRRDSGRNLRAGIVATEHTTDDTDGFFSEPVAHAKGFLRKQVGSDTVRAFEESGAPFIGGASGSMLSEITHIEASDGDRKASEVDADVLAAREKSLGLKMLALVCGGHHSLAECLIPCQQLGYFRTVPDPIGGPGNYAKAMAAFQKRMAALGVGSKKSLT